MNTSSLNSTTDNIFPITNANTINPIRSIAINSIGNSSSAGEIHNRALEYAFNKIRSEKLFLKLDAGNINKLCASILADYFSYFDGQPSKTHEQLMLLLSTVDTDTLIKNISTDLRYALFEIESCARTSNLQSPEKHIESIVVECTTKFNTFEQSLVVIYADVIIHSMRYWDQNISSWVSEYHSQTGGTGKQAARKVNGKGVATADAEGALSGAFFGAATGTCLMGPVGSVAGAIVGAAEGAAVGSLIDIGWQLLFG